MIRQVVPKLDGKKFDIDQYESDKRQLLSDLSRQAASTERFSASLNPYPICYSENEIQTERKLQRILSRAITAIVSNYFNDERIRDIIKLDDRTCELLKCANQTTYHIGAYRPDFIYDTNGEIVICEINARFCSNAFFISHYLRHYDVQGLSSISSSAHLKQYARNNVQAFLGRIPDSNTVYIVKGREAGWDINCMANELLKQGRNCEVIPPSELCRVVSEEDASFILELHQDEILESGIYEALCMLSKRGNYFNDLRTIFIAHDKRMLAVFHRKDIMRDYIDEADFQFLRNHVAETYVLNSIQIRNAARLHRNSWMLKPAQFGKGEGILLGRYLTQEGWERALNNADSAQYVLQKVVIQPQIEVLTKNGQSISSQSMNVVGTILCMDEDYLGPGIYRASENEIVNVASGGTILFPVLYLDRCLRHIKSHSIAVASQAVAAAKG